MVISSQRCMDLFFPNAHSLRHFSVSLCNQTVEKKMLISGEVATSRVASGKHQKKQLNCDFQTLI